MQSPYWLIVFITLMTGRIKLEIRQKRFFTLLLLFLFTLFCQSSLFFHTTLIFLLKTQLFLSCSLFLLIVEKIKYPHLKKIVHQQPIGQIS